MSETVKQPSKGRLIAFGVLAVLFALAAVGPRPFMSPWIVTLWGGDAGDMRSHELHGIVNSFILYATLVAVGLHVLRRHRQQVGALWALALVGIMPLGPMLALDGVPTDVRPIVAVIFVLGVVLFLVHPVPLRDKFRSAHGMSPALLGLAVVLAIPLVVFAAGQYSLHLQNVAGDEHREFGHWLVMGSSSLAIVVLSFITALRVSGFRTAGWFAVATIGFIAVGSLVLPAVHGSAVASAWATPWAVLALVWAAAFAVMVQREDVPAAAAAAPAPAAS
jgi:MFS family permease